MKQVLCQVCAVVPTAKIKLNTYVVRPKQNVEHLKMASAGRASNAQTLG